MPRRKRFEAREMTAAEYHAQIKEGPFTTQTIKLAEGYGWWVWHDQDSRKNTAGLPDLICLHPRHGVVWIELKTETGRIRPEQIGVLALLRRAGERAFIARPRHRDALEALFRGEAVPDDAFEIPEEDQG